MTVKDGAVAEMVLYFRNYTVTNETAQLLPEILAAAASGGTFRLCYPDNGGEDPGPHRIAAVRRVKTVT